MSISSAVAIVGYGCRAPGGIRSQDDLWRIVESGEDVVTRLSSNTGATHQERISAYGRLRDADQFARQYFRYSPRDAGDIEPQQRLLLECAVEALEDGGIGNRLRSYEIGTFLAAGSNQSLSDAGNSLNSSLGKDPQYAATRIAFKLGLEGPAFTIGSACSSSLVAVHLAAQSVLSGECDFALAGGMDIESPQPTSYLYQLDGIQSRTGRVRPFDAEADGTVFGSGGGLVLLADLKLAQHLHLPIRSLLLATAVNNDGSEKASFTAPRTSRQASAISTAVVNAGISVNEIVYHETHGTATAIGDQSELRAISNAYAGRTNTRPVTLGALKANIGHLRVGSGVLGLIKASEVLRRRIAPPIANFSAPSEALDASRLHVPWTAEPLPDGMIAAGVSSFGFGGTNAHAVLGVAPMDMQLTTEEPEKTTIKVSAETPELAVSYREQLLEFIREGNPQTGIAAALQAGHAGRDYRMAFTIDRNSNVQEVAEGWYTPDLRVILILPGQGSNLRNFAKSLMVADSVFNTALLSSWAIFAEQLGTNKFINDILLESEPALSGPERHGLDASIAIAIVDALKKRGLRPSTIVGVSLGEYAAAYAAGVLTLRDVARLVTERADILEGYPNSGGLVAVHGTQNHQLAEQYGSAAIRYANGTTIYATPDPKLLLAAAEGRLVEVDLPYHSSLLTDAATAYRDAASKVVHAKSDQFRSLVEDTGLVEDWGRHWARHLTSTIDLRQLEDEVAGTIIVDATPDGTASRGFSGTVVQLFNSHNPSQWFYALADLWVRGIELDVCDEPTSPLAILPKRKFLTEIVGSNSQDIAPSQSIVKTRRQDDLSHWIYQPSWLRKRRSPSHPNVVGQRWLVFVPNDELGAILKHELSNAGIELACIYRTEGAACDNAGRDHAGYSVVPGDQAGIETIIQAICRRGPIDRMLHLWCTSPINEDCSLGQGLATVDEQLELGFYTILWSVQALARYQGSRPLHLELIARGAHPFDERVSGAHPSRATLNGATFVVPQDFPFVTTRSMDISGLSSIEASTEVVAELKCDDTDVIVAFTPHGRWVRSFVRDSLNPVSPGNALRLRRGGVYLITGGLGGIGTTIASFLARNYSATLILTSLDSAPTEEEVAQGSPASDRSQPELISQRIRSIRELQDLGATVIARASDAADVEAVKQLVGECEARFGRINGLIHAAGVFETQRAFRALDDTNRDDCNRRLQPKVHATVILTHVLRDKNLDFALLQSSLSSHLGGLGFYAYTAGNSFMDAYAERFRSSSFPSMSVNWDGWVFHERAVDDTNSVISPSFASTDFGVVAEIAIRPSEGAAIYEQLMNIEEPHQVLVSTADFGTRINEWVTRKPRKTPTVELPTPGVEMALKGVLSLERNHTQSEQTVGRIWRELLGVKDLELGSNFFALGGDSLAGVNLAYELSRASGAVVSVISLFENPTLEAMARVFEGATMQEFGNA